MDAKRGWEWTFLQEDVGAESSRISGVRPKVSGSWALTPDPQNLTPPQQHRLTSYLPHHHGHASTCRVSFRMITSSLSPDSTRGRSSATIASASACIIELRIPDP